MSPNYTRPWLSPIIPSVALRPLHVLEQGNTLYENVWNTFLHTLPDYTPGMDWQHYIDTPLADKAVLVMPGDIPLATPFEIEAFITSCDLTKYDYFLGLTAEPALRPYYPQDWPIRHTDGLFCLAGFASTPKQSAPGQTLPHGESALYSESLRRPLPAGMVQYCQTLLGVVHHATRFSTRWRLLFVSAPGPLFVSHGLATRCSAASPFPRSLVRGEFLVPPVANTFYHSHDGLWRVYARY